MGGSDPSSWAILWLLPGDGWEVDEPGHRRVPTVDTVTFGDDFTCSATKPVPADRFLYKY